MEFLTDPVLLARIQFALTAMYHYVFVPLSIGLGLIVAIFETKYYRSQSVEDAAASRFWIKVFTATFALGTLVHAEKRTSLFQKPRRPSCICALLREL